MQQCKRYRFAKSVPKTSAHQPLLQNIITSPSSNEAHMATSSHSEASNWGFHFNPTAEVFQPQSVPNMEFAPSQKLFPSHGPDFHGYLPDYNYANNQQFQAEARLLLEQGLVTLEASLNIVYNLIWQLGNESKSIYASLVY